MSAAIERYDTVGRAREELAKRMPDAFTFEISDYNLEGLGLAEGIRRARDLRELEREARARGYEVSHGRNEERQAYVYEFRRDPAEKPEVERPALDDGKTIDV